jgi:tyrosine-protein kinase Etk/Wzc
MNNTILEEDTSAPAAEVLPRPRREETMFEFVALLAERKWTIAKITGSFLLLGFLAWLILPNHYAAETDIMPPKEEPTASDLIESEMGLGGLSALAGQAAGGLLTDPNAVYIGLLKSRPVEDAVIRKFDLMRVYDKKTMKETRDKLERKTDINSEKSTLISVSVTDHDPARAAAMANFYIEELRSLTRTVGITQAQREANYYEEQVQKQKDRLTAAEEAFKSLQTGNGLIELSSQAKVAVFGLADLQAQIAAKEVELQSLKSFSTDRNPDVQIAERELETMKDEVAQLEKHSKTTAYSDMGLKDLPKAGLDYLRAEREFGYQQTIYNLLVKQLEAAKLDAARDSSIIQVVATAVQPEKPSFPLLIIFQPLFTVFGFITSILFIKLQRRIQLEQADPEGALALLRIRQALKLRSKA